MYKKIALLVVGLSLNIGFANEGYKEVDKELNIVYKKIIKNIPDNQKEIFKKIQIEWIKQKEKVCAKNPDLNNCLYQQTKYKLDQLNQIYAHKNIDNCLKKENFFENKDGSITKAELVFCEGLLSSYMVYKDNQELLNSKYILIGDLANLTLEDINNDGFADVILSSELYARSVDLSFFLFSPLKQEFQYFLTDNGYGYEVVDNYLLILNTESYDKGYTNGYLINGTLNIPKNIKSHFNINSEGYHIDCKIEGTTNISQILKNKLCQQ